MRDTEGTSAQRRDDRDTPLKGDVPVVPSLTVANVSTLSLRLSLFCLGSVPSSRNRGPYEVRTRKGAGSLEFDVASTIPKPLKARRNR